MITVGKMFALTCCHNQQTGSNPSTSTTSTRTQDQRVTTGAGDNFAVYDSPISTGGGSFTITSSNADVAKASIEASTALATGAFGAASGLASASNALASQVADAPRLFTQKTILWVIGAVVAVAGFFFWARKR